jgi:hypothetical protein
MTITERTVDLDASGHLHVMHVHGDPQKQGFVQSWLYFVPDGTLVLDFTRAGHKDKKARFALSAEEGDKLAEALVLWRARRHRVSPSDPTP